MCSTPFGITEGVTRCSKLVTIPMVPVLNAFRHHGGRHATIPDGIGWPRDRCSTPFGITEGVTRPGRAPLARRTLVLNAFRHHGGRHAESNGTDRPFILCSTPFGITEGVTSCSLTGRGVPEPCSTPFGITEGVTGGGGMRIVLALVVLNAFRHHGGRHASQSSVSARYVCAQRLSASRRASRSGRAVRATVAASVGAQRLSASRRASPPAASRSGR